MTPPRPRTIVCDVGCTAPDAATVDALARLQLNARRVGQEVRLSHVSNELQELLDFVGLGEVLRVEPFGQAKEREEGVGIEEERELDDPAG
jgi:STAS domain